MKQKVRCHRLSEQSKVVRATGPPLPVTSRPLCTQRDTCAEVGASGPDTGSERGPALAASQERQERTQPLSSMSRTFSRPLPFCFADFLYCFPVFNFIDSCS